MSKKVYNPDRTDLKFLCGGKSYTLKSKASTSLPDDVATHAVEILPLWGVSIDTGPKSIADAKAVHAKGVQSHFERVLAEHAKKNGPSLAAGLPVVESDEVKEAKQFLTA